MARFHRGARAALLAVTLLGVDRALAAPIALNAEVVSSAMHIAEGFLPPLWAAFWFALCLPFWFLGLRALRRLTAERPESRVLLGLSTAFAFVLSALKMPSVTGSSSHPTGTGLGAMLFGPWTMSILGTIVLLFQALLLAHGGLTTLGANAFSMAIVGPIVAYALFKLSRRAGVSLSVAVFLAAAAADLATYLTTSLQLALAFPATPGGVVASFARFAGIFAVTQVPLAMSEGLLTVIIVNALLAQSPHEVRRTELATEVR